MRKIIPEIKWRGLIINTTNGISDIFKRKVSLYSGFDPTSSSLHIGNLISIILSIHFKNYGHNVFFLLGTSTSLIGDPSGKKGERSLMKKHDIFLYSRKIRKQLFKFSKQFKIPILNNNWNKKLKFLEFSRNIGKCFDINYMLNKDSVKKRRLSLSFTEFTYQLLQAYDFYYLYKNQKCVLQIGGSDQWGNITCGIELIKKKQKTKVHGLTHNLLTKSDGTKFGKTENGDNIWLDPKLTSPYKFYQFWMNISDVQAKKLIKIFTFYNKRSIYKIITLHDRAPFLRILQRKIAKATTILVHSKKTFTDIYNINQILFNQKRKNMNTFLRKKDFLLFQKYLPCKKILLNSTTFNFKILDLLILDNFICKSKTEVLRKIKFNSLLLNMNTFFSDYVITKKDLIYNHFILIKKGKKNFYILYFQY
ncbi:tyrosine--tRNA ligase [Candidatus Karelsulcia muelleri]|uniref:tyrosine--tRNA ligase n=1 Tax=Candidatus Karelsulcia muelleri TaxID=336810 RepID=UPI0023637D98|nr:tyrosine--tRNA ligase [Candidatus Karelsulcia muelleri]WDE42214.1 tyrosine--tRNA ligase [Candidatus Karelsulcia muelleri]WDR79061.1 tyrosine--tRNA ligase [Candidatus Karelsulcia muelleri]